MAQIPSGSRFNSVMNTWKPDNDGDIQYRKTKVASYSRNLLRRKCVTYADPARKYGMPFGINWNGGPKVYEGEPRVEHLESSCDISSLTSERHRGLKECSGISHYRITNCNHDVPLFILDSLPNSTAVNYTADAEPETFKKTLLPGNSTASKIQSTLNKQRIDSVFYSIKFPIESSQSQSSVSYF